MEIQTIFILALIGFIGSVSQWFSWWIKIPSILMLLLSGFLLGPILGVLNPDELFGELLFPIVSLSVAVILFEGALTLNFREIKGHGNVVTKLVSIGMLVTWIIVSVFTYYLMNLDWKLSFLFGALVVVTGPTVIVPMLRILKLNTNIANILKWEGIVIDPIGATLAVLIFGFIESVNSNTGGIIDVFLAFLKILATGGIVGLLGGFILSFLLKRHLLPGYLHNVFTLNLIFMVFVISNSMAHESGLLAVTLMGMLLANTKKINISGILNFKESLTLLLISGLFIILAARTDLNQLLNMGWKAILLLIVIQFIARPVSVFISTYNSSLNWREKAMLAWIAPRGIVAAAVSALFALQLEQQGIAEAAELVNLTFFVIVGTVVFQSLTAKFIGVSLKVANPHANGVLIVGGNPVALAIAEALNKEGFNSLIVDSYWKNIQNARMKKIQSFYGNPVSEHADHNLDLIGFGKMLAISMNTELNYLSANRYRSEFGEANVFTLQNTENNADEKKHDVHQHTKGLNIFGNDVSYKKLASLLSNNGMIKSTNITSEFSFESYIEENKGHVIPLFAINTKNNELNVLTGKDSYAQIQNDWKVLGLIYEQNN
ncbi:MAG: cation:proton antiporter [Marinicellaceae bacterium]